MNISFNMNNPYYSPYIKNAQGNLYARQQGGAMKNTVMGKAPANPIKESKAAVSDEMMADLGKMISEFG